MSAPPDRAPAGTPLYVHLPFCAAKCHYCDFYSIASEGQDIDGTVDAVLVEAERRAPREPRTVFFGGGTPSLLSIEQLRRLLDGLERITGFRGSSVETTLESNPESVDRDKAEALRELGVGRLSIGFQSLEPATLELFGRVHGVEDSFRAFEAARAGGFDEINVDLIYAAPGHDEARWAVDLPRVLALGPAHVSAYALAFEEETLFSKWLAEGTLEKQPEERELALFHQTRRILGEHGFEAYEVSNFARAGHRARHNGHVWRGGHYMGLGPSAHGFRPDGTRTKGRSGVEAWLTEPVGPLEHPSPEEAAVDLILSTLRHVDGVPVYRLSARTGFTIDRAPLRPHLARGLLVDDTAHGTLRLGPPGWPVADGLVRTLVDALIPATEAASRQA